MYFGVSWMGCGFGFCLGCMREDVGDVGRF